MNNQFGIVDKDKYIHELQDKVKELEKEIQEEHDLVGSWFLNHNYLFDDDLVYDIENTLGIELPFYVEEKVKPKFGFKPIKTHNENGDRWVLDHDEDDGSVYVYDNYKRDGYGIYAGEGYTFSNNQKIRLKTIIMLVDKINELFKENQYLKNNDKAYHKLVMNKLKKEAEHYFDLWQVAMKKNHKDNADFYLEVYKALYDVRDYTIQGEEYE